MNFGDEVEVLVVINRGYAGEMRQGCPLSPVLLNVFLERIIQKAFTPEHLSEYDCFAGDEVKDAE